MNNEVQHIQKLKSQTEESVSESIDFSFFLLFYSMKATCVPALSNVKHSLDHAKCFLLNCTMEHLSR